MDQISPPMRIVLAVAVVFLAAYMLVLKPKDEAAPAPTPATAPASEAGGPDANTSLGEAVENAGEAAGAAESAQQARSGETESNRPGTTQAAPGSPAAKSGAGSDKAADPALAKLPDWLGDSIDKKVVALLFTKRDATDDKRTAAALERAYDADGEVVTRSVPVAEISKYRAVAEGVDVSQSPTLLVIARDRSAQVLAGYASLKTINQAIIDALLATHNPVKTVDFLKLAQRECTQISNRALIGVTEGATPAGAEKNVNATIAIMTASLGELRNAPAPAAYKPIKAQLTRFIASEIAVGRQIVAAIGPGAVDPIKIKRAAASNDKLEGRTILELNAVGVDACN